MAQLRAAAPRARMTMLNQLALSITATVLASVILTGARYELDRLRAPPVAHDLTTGGKFAARVEALRSTAEETVPLGVAVARVPLLAADPALRALPASFAADVEPDLPRTPPVDSVKAPKRPVRAEVRRRLIPDPARDVAPARRNEVLAAADQTAAIPAAETASAGLWTATKTFYRQAVDAGDDALRRLNPLSLLN